jgi:quercetin dioxygenase-like cupin family protein
MQIVDHKSQATEEWRPGVLTQMQISALTGAGQLCIFQQWCAPGAGAPTHAHPVEEVLTILDGQAELWVGDEREVVSTGQSVFIPAGSRHGFRNTGMSTLHVQATLAAPIFEALFEGQTEMTRRWLPHQL